MMNKEIVAEIILEGEEFYISEDKQLYMMVGPGV